MKEHFSEIVDVEFTAQMESKLDTVEEGKKDWRDVLFEFYPQFESKLKKADSLIGEVKIPDEETDVVCDKCGRNMVIKSGRYGKFLACPGFPGCRNTNPYWRSRRSMPQVRNVIVRKQEKAKVSWVRQLPSMQVHDLGWLQGECPQCQLHDYKTPRQEVHTKVQRRECGFEIEDK